MKNNSKVQDMVSRQKTTEARHKRVLILCWTIMVWVLVAACTTPAEKPLPIFGEREVVGSDTIYHTIDDFSFIDQDSAEITKQTFDGKIYVADFFFTSCRTICPIMKTQMLRVYDSVENDPDVLILSHTIDPEYDTVALLREIGRAHV